MPARSHLVPLATQNSSKRSAMLSAEAASGLSLAGGLLMSPMSTPQTTREAMPCRAGPAYALVLALVRITTEAESGEGRLTTFRLMRCSKTGFGTYQSVLRKLTRSCFC